MSLNEKIAGKATLVFGSMWCAWAFLALALFPLAVPGSVVIVAFVSQTVIQLVALPLLMVGGTVLSRDAERERKEDHKALVEILADMRDDHKALVEILADMRVIISDTSE